MWVLLLLLSSSVAATNVTFRESRAEDVLWSGDPYVDEVRGDCGRGYLWSCVKERGLEAAEGFFRKEEWTFNRKVRMVKMPRSELMRLASEPYRFSSEPRSGEPELMKLLKYLYR